MEEQYYISIKEKLLKSEIYNKARDYAKDRHKVKVYYEIGELLSKAGKDYGKNIIKQYSEKLMIEVGKKYNYRTLYRMRKFYELFDNEKLTTMLSKLSWFYFNEVLSLKNTIASITLIAGKPSTLFIIKAKSDKYNSRF